MSTQFATGPTRDIQPGDTPDLNDGLLSRLILNALNLVRGQASVLIDGEIVIATPTNIVLGHTPFVPIESVDNTNDGLEASGVTAPQRVALAVQTTADLNPGDYVKPFGTAGFVEKWVPADDQRLKYARYLGREAGLLDRKVTTRFDETLTPGIVPDESILSSEPDGTVGWFQLVESIGGAEI